MCTQLVALRLAAMTRLLVLGGSAFVGRAIVDDALARGWEVTTFNRGVTAAAYAQGRADADAHAHEGEVAGAGGDGATGAGGAGATGAGGAGATGAGGAGATGAGGAGATGPGGAGATGPGGDTATGAGGAGATGPGGDGATGPGGDGATGADGDSATSADGDGANAESRRPARPARPTRLIGDRTDAATLSQLTNSTWDLVVDTWSGKPAVVRDSARLLAERAGCYVYISSGSVYAPPPPVGADEDSPTVEASPDDTGGDDYARCKRGAELAVLNAFGERRALIVRPGLILGPHEDVGRLPWWLQRVSGGGQVLAPGPPERPLQLIDARDLARFVLDAATDGHAGVFNTVSRRGHATTQSLLDSCVDVAGASDTRLTWASPDVIEQAGIEPWTQLPIWLPPGHEYEGLHGADVDRAHAAGLRCRPIQETVADTWAWMRSLDGPPPRKPGLPPPGVDRSTERTALALAHAAR
jgi:2'-hydroxyisoflavone reductase